MKPYVSTRNKDFNIDYNHSSYNGGTVRYNQNIYDRYQNKENHLSPSFYLSNDRTSRFEPRNTPQQTYYHNYQQQQQPQPQPRQSKSLRREDSSFTNNKFATISTPKLVELKKTYLTRNETKVETTVKPSRANYQNYYSPQPNRSSSPKVVRVINHHNTQPSSREYTYKNQVYIQPYANQPVNISPIYEKKLTTPIDNKTRVEVTDNYMGSPDVFLTKEIKCLGVYEVDPNEYEQVYGHELINPEEIPEIQFELPNGHELASSAQYYYEDLPPLVGDVEALQLIGDLDKVGLGQYKPYVNLLNEYKYQANSPVSSARAPVTGTWNNHEIGRNNISTAITGQSDNASLRSSSLSPYLSQSSNSSMSSNFN